MDIKKNRTEQNSLLGVQQRELEKKEEVLVEVLVEVLLLLVLDFLRIFLLPLTFPRLFCPTDYSSPANSRAPSLQSGAKPFQESDGEFQTQERQPSRISFFFLSLCMRLSQKQSGHAEPLPASKLHLYRALMCVTDLSLHPSHLPYLILPCLPLERDCSTTTTTERGTRATPSRPDTCSISELAFINTRGCWKAAQREF